MSKAESVILAGALFALFMTLFGQTSMPQSGSTVLNSITAGPPTLASQVTFTNCGLLDFGCAANNVATATAAIALVLSYPFILLYWFFQEVGLFSGFLIASLVGPQQGAVATPLVAFFFGLLFVYVVFEGMRILRGNSTAGV